MAPNLSSLLWFIAILIAIPAVLWLLRQSPLGRLHGLRPGGTELPMRTVSSLALSPSQRVVTVEVGTGTDRRWLVLGVTPGCISTLHQIEPSAASAMPNSVTASAPGSMAAPASDAPNTPAQAALLMPAGAPPFAQMLARLLRARGTGDHV